MMEAPTTSRDGALAGPPMRFRPSAGPGVISIFFATFIGSCALLGCFLPFPRILIIRDKLEYLARHGDDYDVVFIGSSHIQGQVMPSVFDEVTCRAGVRVKSFNAGVAGMFAPEDGYVLEQILQRPHHRLRWVFFELSHVRTSLEREGTARFTYWHDWPRLSLIVRRLWQQAVDASAPMAKNPQASFAQRWDIWSTMGETMAGHIHQWLARAVNLGRGNDLLAQWSHERDSQRESGKSLGPMGDGWMTAFGVPQLMPPEPRAKYLASYEERLATPATRERNDPVSQVALQRLVATVRRSGAVPIFVVPPTTEAGYFYPPAEREKDISILDFSDVRKYPELYDPDHRIDLDHLNTSGAKIFSAALAQYFVPMVNRTQGTP
ncbi:MAG TPA: hypothetical protein VGM54_24770 [Chthoniobacter sp.]|jgi:hypothetical protein